MEFALLYTHVLFYFCVASIQNESASENEQGPSNIHHARSSKNLPRTAGRPKDFTREHFPIDLGQFQYRVLYLLTDLRSEVKQLHKNMQLVQTNVLMNSNGEQVNDTPIEQAETIEDLEDVESRLRNVEFSRIFRKWLEAMALSCCSSKEHVRCIINTLISKQLQVFVNVVYGNNVPNKHYSNHLSMTRDLPLLLALIISAVMKKYPRMSDRNVKTEISEYLKQATKRLARV